MLAFNAGVYTDTVVGGLPSLQAYCSGTLKRKQYCAQQIGFPVRALRRGAATLPEVIEVGFLRGPPPYKPGYIPKFGVDYYPTTAPGGGYKKRTFRTPEATRRSAVHQHQCAGNLAPSSGPSEQTTAAGPYRRTLKRLSMRMAHAEPSVSVIQLQPVAHLR